MELNYVGWLQVMTALSSLKSNKLGGYIVNLFDNRDNLDLFYS